LFLGGILLHAAFNLNVFTGYFSKKAGLGIIGAAALVTTLSLLPVFGEGEEGHGKESTGKAAVQALESSSLETVALVLKATPEELAARLEKEGIDAANASMTIAEIAQKSGKEERMVLGALFGKPGKGGEGRVEGDDDDH